MPRLSQAASFDRTISQLLAKRREYTEGLAQIDGIFAKYHIQVTNGTAPVARQRRSRVRTAKPARAQRKRRSFPQTADEFLIGLLKSKPMITGEINTAWKRAGRGGTADNSLGKLVNEKKLKRSPAKDGRGSNYSAL